jgi:hypothetical protein
MFITIQRQLPKGITDCLINIDHVVWIQALPPGPSTSAQTRLLMAYGDVVDSPESFQRVAEKFTRR